MQLKFNPYFCRSKYRIPLSVCIVQVEKWWDSARWKENRVETEEKQKACSKDKRKESQTRIKDILMALQWIIQKVHYEEKHTEEKEKEKNTKNKSSPVPKIYLWILLGWLSFQQSSFHILFINYSYKTKAGEDAWQSEARRVGNTTLHNIFLLSEKIL